MKDGGGVDRPAAPRTNRFHPSTLSHLVYNSAAMAKWWEYPVWRRNVLIAITWSLFAGSLALAAAVSAHQHGKLESGFSAPVPCGPFAVRLPVGWSGTLRTGGLLRIDAVEPVQIKRLTRPRRLVFLQRALTPGATVEDFISQEPALSGRVIMQTDTVDDAEAYTIAGYEGVSYIRMLSAIYANNPVFEYVGVVVTPEGQALAVKLICDGKPSEADRPLLHSVLDRVAMKQ